MKFWCDFSASVQIEAETIDEAREKFFDLTFSNDDLNFIDLNYVEPIEEG